MKTPEHTTAEAFPRYVGGKLLADSATRQWPGFFVRRYRFPTAVDGFLVPATAEPLIACTSLLVLQNSRNARLAVFGYPATCSAETSSSPDRRTPYELRWRSPSGAELDVIHIHLALDQCRAVFETVYRDMATAVEVIEFFGQDETLAHLIFAGAKMLSTRTAGSSQSVAAIARLLAIHVAEKYTNFTSPKLD